MKVTIRADGVAFTPSLRRQVEHRLHVALHAFEGHIAEVRLSIRDVNGPRGGADKHGQVLIVMWSGVPLVVKATAGGVPSLVSQLAAASRGAVRSRVRRHWTWPVRKLRRQAGPGRRARALAHADPAKSVAG